MRLKDNPIDALNPLDHDGRDGCLLFQSSTAQKVAGLKAKVQELGLEGKPVGQGFSDLFGQHFSTAIAMAALHLLQGKGYISSLSIKKTTFTLLH